MFTAIFFIPSGNTRRLDTTYVRVCVRVCACARARVFAKYKVTFHNFMFEFPCIIRQYYIKDQRDATLAVCLLVTARLHVSDAFCVHHQEYKKLLPLPVQWQPTLDILTRYITFRHMTRTSGC
jgi:hypothetical protein